MDSGSCTSPVTVVTPSGSGRTPAVRPRFSTCTSMPWRTDSATQDELIVPVPPM